GSGYISQGEDLSTARVITFWSGKFNSAQQNYPVHERELLAIVESLKRFRPQLHGVKFRICTDHKSLIHFMSQKNLSQRQMRWLYVMNEFDFTVEYIPGETNVLADGLSRIYSDDQPGTVRATSEIICDDSDSSESDGDTESESVPLSAPVFVGRAVLLTNDDEHNAPRRSARVRGEMAPPVPEIRLRRPNRPQQPSAAPETAIETEETVLGPDETEGESDIDSQRNSTLVSDEEPETEGGTIGKVVSAMSPSLNGDERIYMKSGPTERRLLCIPDISVKGKRLRPELIDQAHSILAHLGAHKTLLYLRQDVWWKRMVDDVRVFVESCHVCRTTKDNTQKPMGLLQTLPVPVRPWQVIGIDFIGPLPVSQARHGRYDRICTIIDHFTSMVHLVPARTTYTAPDMAELLFHSVYKLHGLPEAIVSDHDVLFTSPFWTRLHELTGVELRMSTAYHPQTDGATERANRTVGQMVRQCISDTQKDWAAKLPAIEFALNSSTSATTGFSPFFMNYGHHPNALTWQRVSTYPGVERFAETMREALFTAHDAIISARVAQTTQANKHRQAATFKTGDQVYLSTKNLKIPKGLKRKLIRKYIGPFEISETV
ncbi:hypothetical protein AURDEDRAFT_36803, partial [Auricularia subglabra TFB-10046 SS5]